MIKNVTLNKGNNKIDLTEYPAGTYLLKGNSTSSKIMKK